MGAVSGRPAAEETWASGLKPDESPKNQNQ